MKVRPDDAWGCWADGPKPHPWVEGITDVACGYEQKMQDSRCNQCHAQREDWPAEQLLQHHMKLHPNALKNL